MTASFEPRFWAKVERRDPDWCWLWTGGKAKAGYGTFGLPSSTANAHQLAYQMLVGPIPIGKQIDHLCRNRACVNPKHMEPVTSRENTLRGVSPAAQNIRKTHCPRGHPYDEANTYIRTDRAYGGRHCRRCSNEQRRAHHHRRLAVEAHSTAESA